MPSGQLPKVPEGLRDLMKGLTKEILREKPTDLYEFSAQYFEAIVRERKDFTVQEFEPVSEYDYMKNREERHSFPTALIYSIIPVGLTELIKDFIKAVLRQRPENICVFAVDYFRRLQKIKKNERIDYLTFEKSKEQFAYVPYVRCTCGGFRGIGTGYANMNTNNNNEGEFNVDKITNHEHCSTNVEFTHLNGGNGLVGKEHKPNVTKQLELAFDERTIKAVYIIQKFCRRYIIKKKSVLREKAAQKSNEQNGNAVQGSEGHLHHLKNKKNKTLYSANSLEVLTTNHLKGYSEGDDESLLENLEELEIPLNSGKENGFENLNNKNDGHTNKIHGINTNNSESLDGKNEITAKNDRTSVTTMNLAHSKDTDENRVIYVENTNHGISKIKSQKLDEQILDLGKLNDVSKKIEETLPINSTVIQKNKTIVENEQEGEDNGLESNILETTAEKDLSDLKTNDMTADALNNGEVQREKNETKENTISKKEKESLEHNKSVESTSEIKKNSGEEVEKFLNLKITENENYKETQDSENQKNKKGSFEFDAKTDESFVANSDDKKTVEAILESLIHSNKDNVIDKNLENRSHQSLGNAKNGTASDEIVGNEENILENQGLTEVIEQDVEIGNADNNLKNVSNSKEALIQPNKNENMLKSSSQESNDDDMALKKSVEHLIEETTLKDEKQETIALGEIESSKLSENQMEKVNSIPEDSQKPNGTVDTIQSQLVSTSSDDLKTRNLVEEKVSSIDSETGLPRSKREVEDSDAGNVVEKEKLESLHGTTPLVRDEQDDTNIGDKTNNPVLQALDSEEMKAKKRGDEVDNLSKHSNDKENDDIRSQTIQSKELSIDSNQKESTEDVRDVQSKQLMKDASKEDNVETDKTVKAADRLRDGNEKTLNKTHELEKLDTEKSQLEEDTAETEKLESHLIEKEKSKDKVSGEEKNEENLVKKDDLYEKVKTIEMVDEKALEETKFEEHTDETEKEEEKADVGESESNETEKLYAENLLIHPKNENEVPESIAGITSDGDREKTKELETKSFESINEKSEEKVGSKDESNENELRTKAKEDEEKTHGTKGGEEESKVEKLDKGESLHASNDNIEDKNKLNDKIKDAKKISDHDSKEEKRKEEEEKEYKRSESGEIAADNNKEIYEDETKKNSESENSTVESMIEGKSEQQKNDDDSVEKQSIQQIKNENKMATESLEEKALMTSKEEEQDKQSKEPETEKDETTSEAKKANLNSSEGNKKTSLELQSTTDNINNKKDLAENVLSVTNIKSLAKSWDKKITNVEDQKNIERKVTVDGSKTGASEENEKSAFNEGQSANENENSVVTEDTENQKSPEITVKGENKMKVTEGENLDAAANNKNDDTKERIQNSTSVDKDTDNDKEAENRENRYDITKISDEKTAVNQKIATEIQDFLNNERNITEVLFTRGKTLNNTNNSREAPKSEELGGEMSTKVMKSNDEDQLSLETAKNSKIEEKGETKITHETSLHGQGSEDNITGVKSTGFAALNTKVDEALTEDTEEKNVSHESYSSTNADRAEVDSSQEIGDSTIEEQNASNEEGDSDIPSSDGKLSKRAAENSVKATANEKASSTQEAVIGKQTAPKLTESKQTVSKSEANEIKQKVPHKNNESPKKPVPKTNENQTKTESRPKEKLTTKPANDKISTSIEATQASNLKEDTSNSKENPKNVEENVQSKKTTRVCQIEGLKNEYQEQKYIQYPIAEIYLKSFRVPDNDDEKDQVVQTEHSPKKAAPKHYLNLSTSETSDQATETEFSDSLNEENFERDSLEVSSSKETDIEEDSLELGNARRQQERDNSVKENTSERMPTYLFGMPVTDEPAAPKEQLAKVKKAIAFVIPFERPNKVVIKDYRTTDDIVNEQSSELAEQTSETVTDEDIEIVEESRLQTIYEQNEAESPREEKLATQVADDLATSSDRMKRSVDDETDSKLVENLRKDKAIDKAGFVAITHSDNAPLLSNVEDKMKNITEASDDTLSFLSDNDSNTESSTFTPSKDFDEPLLSDDNLNFHDDLEYASKSRPMQQSAGSADNTPKGGIYEMDPKSLKLALQTSGNNEIKSNSISGEQKDNEISQEKDQHKELMNEKKEIRKDKTGNKNNDMEEALQKSKCVDNENVSSDKHKEAVSDDADNHENPDKTAQILKEEAEANDKLVADTNDFLSNERKIAESFLQSVKAVSGDQVQKEIEEIETNKTSKISTMKEEITKGLHKVSQIFAGNTNLFSKEGTEEKLQVEKQQICEKSEHIEKVVEKEDQKNLKADNKNNEFHETLQKRKHVYKDNVRDDGGKEIDNNALDKHESLEEATQISSEEAAANRKLIADTHDFLNNEREITESFIQQVKAVSGDKRNEKKNDGLNTERAGERDVNEQEKFVIKKNKSQENLAKVISENNQHKSSIDFETVTETQHNLDTQVKLEPQILKLNSGMIETKVQSDEKNGSAEVQIKVIDNNEKVMVDNLDDIALETKNLTNILKCVQNLQSLDSNNEGEKNDEELVNNNNNNEPKISKPETETTEPTATKVINQNENKVEEHRESETKKENISINHLGEPRTEQKHEIEEVVIHNQNDALKEKLDEIGVNIEKEQISERNKRAIESQNAKNYVHSYEPSVGKDNETEKAEFSNENIEAKSQDTQSIRIEETKSVKPLEIESLKNQIDKAIEDLDVKTQELETSIEDEISVVTEPSLTTEKNFIDELRKDTEELKQALNNEVQNMESDLSLGTTEKLIGIKKNTDKLQKILKTKESDEVQNLEHVRVKSAEKSLAEVFEDGKRVQEKELIDQLSLDKAEKLPNDDRHTVGTENISAPKPNNVGKEVVEKQKDVNEELSFKTTEKLPDEVEKDINNLHEDMKMSDNSNQIAKDEEKTTLVFHKPEENKNLANVYVDTEPKSPPKASKRDKDQKKSQSLLKMNTNPLEQDATEPLAEATVRNGVNTQSTDTKDRQSTSTVDTEDSNENLPAVKSNKDDSDNELKDTSELESLDLTDELTLSSGSRHSDTSNSELITIIEKLQEAPSPPQHTPNSCLDSDNVVVVSEINDATQTIVNKDETNATDAEKVNWFVGEEPIKPKTIATQLNSLDLINTLDQHQAENLIVTKQAPQVDSVNIGFDETEVANNIEQIEKEISTNKPSNEEKIVSAVKKQNLSDLKKRKSSIEEYIEAIQGSAKGTIDNESENQKEKSLKHANDLKEQEEKSIIKRASETEAMTSEHKDIDESNSQTNNASNAEASSKHNKAFGTTATTIVDMIKATESLANSQKHFWGVQPEKQTTKAEVEETNTEIKSTNGNDIQMTQSFLESEVVYNSNISCEEIFEEPCIRKSVSQTTINEIGDESKTKTETQTVDESTVNKNSNESSKESSLTEGEQNILISEAFVEKMQKRRSIELEAAPNIKEKSFEQGSFDDPVIKTMESIVSSRTSTAEDSDEVIIKNTVTPQASFDYDPKATLKRLHTIAVDDTKVLYKSVTIDETVKYIELTTESEHTPTSTGSLCLDDDTSENIRQKMMAYSLSEADSDLYEPKEVSFDVPRRDDFDINTALEDTEETTSTETESTIVSAATKIQAGARGFLTRRRLRRLDTKSLVHDGTRDSFGNNAISESLETMVENAAAKKIQKAYRNHRRSAGDGGVEKKKSTKMMSHENSLAAKRLTLQRNDALRNSSPEEEESNAEGVKAAVVNEAEALVDKVEEFAVEKTSGISGSKASISSKTKMTASTSKSNELKWLASRQRSMPVQIDCEVFRIIPKLLRKRVTSAEEANKKRKRRVLYD